MSIAQLRTGKLASARRIARALGEAEGAIDTAIVAQAELMSAIVRGRREAGSAIHVGHAAFQRASAAMVALAEARDHEVTCHDELAGVRDHYRMSAEDVGCTSDKYTGEIKQAEAA